MAAEWNKVSDEVLALANEIIEEYHPELKEFNIGFVFRSKASISGGRRIIGQASKVTGKISAFVDLDGLVWLSGEDWPQLNSIQRRALIDHELCHFEVNQEGGLIMRGHDIEEFKCIVDRYGLWKSDLIHIAPSFYAQVAQVKLPGFERNGGVVAIDPDTFKVKVVGGLVG